MDGAVHGGAVVHRGVLRPHRLHRQLYAGQSGDRQRLWLGVRPQPAAGPHLHRRLPHHRVPGGLFPLPAARQQAAHHADAGDAAHVDELSAPYLRMDGSAEHQRPCECRFGRLRPRTLQHAEYLRRCGAGHGVQLCAVYDPAPLHQHDQNRPEHRGGGAGPPRLCSGCSSP